jgi:Flp pilus assembly protein TadG
MRCSHLRQATGARCRPSQHGVAAVELALLLAPLLVMLFGVTELGRAIYTYTTLDKTVRDAARHLSQHGPGDALIAAEARCLAVHGNADCTGPALATGLSTQEVVLCDAVLCPATHAGQSTGLGAVNLVSVAITGYAWSSAVPWVVPDMRFNAISVTLRAQL